MSLRIGLIAIVALTAVLLLAGSVAVNAADGQVPTREAGLLELAAHPTAMAPSGEVFIRVTNSGEGPLTGITLRATLMGDGVLSWRQPGSDLSVAADPVDAAHQVQITIQDLPPNTSTLVPLVLSSALGQPSSVIVDGVAQANGGRVDAVLTVEVAGRMPTSLSLAGSSRMTDATPAEVTVTVGNTAGSAIVARLKATAGHHDSKLLVHATDEDSYDALCAYLLPGQSAVAYIEARAKKPVRQGKVAVLAVADVTQASGVQSSTVPAGEFGKCASEVPTGGASVTATREIDVDLAASALLPSFGGVSTALLFPGIAALAGWFTVRYLDDKRRGLTPKSLTTLLWENKSALVIAAVISVIAAAMAAGTGGVDLWDAIDIPGLAVVTVITGMVSVVVALAVVAIHQFRVPNVVNSIDTRKVVRAALKAEPQLGRTLFSTADGQQGLLVHVDRGFVVLTPAYQFSRPSPIARAIQDKDVDEVLRQVAEPAFDGTVSRAGGPWIPVTAVFDKADLTVAGSHPLLHYVDEDRGEDGR